MSSLHLNCHYVVSSSEGVVIRPMELRKTSARPHFYTNEDECDKNVQNFLSCIKMAADTSEANSAFAAIKVTALGKPEFLVMPCIHNYCLNLTCI